MSDNARVNSEHQCSTSKQSQQTHETRNYEEGVQDEPVQYDVSGIFEEVEDIQMYNKGGHHPIHLGDILDGRFEVVHKLGSGGFANAWFCYETTTKKWKAVKVMSADHSSDTEIGIYEHLRKKASLEQLEAYHITIPSESFWLDGPNGRHLCFVMPILGHSMSHWRLRLDSTQKETEAQVQSGCRQIVEAVQFLHRNGICHGDLKPQNVLMKLDGLDTMDRDQVIELLGEPELIEVETVSGDPPQPKAPEYVVCPVSSSWCKSLISSSVAIVDFGESFFVEAPPKRPGHTAIYAAPEVFFEGSWPPGLYSDIWSLACTIFEIRDGGPLFMSLSRPGLYHSLSDLELFIGALPEPFRAARTNMIRGAPSEPDLRFFGDGFWPDHFGGFETEEIEPLTYTCEELKQARDERIKDTGYSTILEATLGRERLRRRSLAERKDLSDGDKEDNMFIRYRFHREGVIHLSALLCKMLKYNPRERLTIDQVLDDPWISPRSCSPTVCQVHTAPEGTPSFTSAFTNVLSWLMEWAMWGCAS
ncbi:hypothetical protein O1611_g957 [Lasiodiplodia mahajangana]|uniref:Uncharacterized protein n=1 Tax=Lasiodiplodia mahajangana TaxID=1108764 RepID=A0ACC2JYV2_9PEZI|nr:hypothetical protein O1611_g957 [Lasiodiplodia mahajangana]